MTTTPPTTRRYKNEINFTNNTEKKVVIETYYQVCQGLDSYDETEVEPYQTYNSKISSTGEWKVRYSYEDCPKLSSIVYLGKFRNVACAMGEFSWMYSEDFNIIRESPDVFSIERVPKKMG